MALRKVFPRQGHQREGDQWEALLHRLRAECRHFRNPDFRNAVTENLVNSGTLEAIIKRSYMSPDGQEVPFGGKNDTLATQISKSSRLGGISCSGRRVPHVEVRVDSVLDVAVSLQEASEGLPHCNKVAIVFAGHPPLTTNGDRGISQEESELLGRTTWGEAFFTVGCDGQQGRSRLNVPSVEASRFCDQGYIQAGAPECLVAENLWLVRHASRSDDTTPGAWRVEPRDFSAISFLPVSSPPLIDNADGRSYHPTAASLVSSTSSRRSIYADKDSRVKYRSQVEAAIKVCSLLDCDGIAVGCAEGICGSELFGHPLAEVAEVWRDVLSQMGAQFRMVSFALGKDTPSNRRCTTGFLAEALGARAVN